VGEVPTTGDLSQGHRMSALPRGMIAFLMTDVVGSTRLWQLDADVMDQALVALDAEVGGIVGGHGGVVITARGEGDSHFAVFERASCAVRSAVELQRRRLPIAAGVSVRAAVHAGEATLRDGNYYGTAVNHAARLRSCAHGGQIICSRVIAEIAGDLDAVTFRSLGIHRVRDLPRPIELFQVEAEGLTYEYPPPVTLETATSAVMTVAVVDSVGARDRLREPEPHEWQRSLFRTLRSTSRAYDGRFLKLTGDGCMVAFEDPRAAVAFAKEVCADMSMSLRGAVATGIVEIIEGELSGAPVLEAWDHIGKGRAGEVWLAPLVSGLLDGE
jgi:class 3 adenylate cyclase